MAFTMGEFGAATVGLVCAGMGRAGENRSVNASQALNVWIIQIVVAIGPPLGGLIFTVYMKTELGNFTVLSDPRWRWWRFPRCAFRGSRCFVLLRSGSSLRSRRWPPSPYIAAEELAVNPNGAATYGARSQLARELTQAWHTRFQTRDGPSSPAPRRSASR